MVFMGALGAISRVTRCPALLLTVIPQIGNVCFIIWHLSNSCLEKAVRAVIRGRAELFDHVKLGRRYKLRVRPPTRTNANQIRTACRTRTAKKRKSKVGKV